MKKVLTFGLGMILGALFVSVITFAILNIYPPEVRGRVAIYDTQHSPADPIALSLVIRGNEDCKITCNPAKGVNFIITISLYVPFNGHMISFYAMPRGVLPIPVILINK